MTTKQLVTCSILIISISLISVATYHFCFSKKTAYIEIKKVFNAFILKKELEDKYAVTVKYRARIIDSLATNLKILSSRLQEDKDNQELSSYFENKRAEFFKSRSQFDEDNRALSQKYDTQILEQMTQYVIDFGKKNNYKYIFGADGNGVLMYAEEHENINEEIILFINNKYKGIE